MSIDLSSITEIRDKIGIITKITDASGMVLWKAAPAMITITLEGIAQSYVEISDDYYRWEDITVEVPSGTMVRCCNASSENRDKESWIYHNDTMVVDGMGFYEFTATKNTTIRESSWKSDYGTYSVGVYITEIPEGHALLSIDYSDPEQFSTSVDGVSYNDTTITVPIGSVVEISAFNLSCYKGCSDGSASVYINDNLVASESEGIDYSYTVRGNTAITSYVNPSYCRDCDNYAYDAIINITEQ